MRQITPGVAVGAIVLPNRSPRTVAEIRPPAPPGIDIVFDLLKTKVFFGRHCVRVGKVRIQAYFRESRTRRTAREASGNVRGSGDPRCVMGRPNQWRSRV